MLQITRKPVATTRFETDSEAFRVACQGEANVLITGPTGSGKSHLAKIIHSSGPRKSKPFVAVNLATLHEGTFESELFGHERGAFTGADQRRIGRLELAQGGTVFLDELGELSPRLQARLLEFLQSRTICPLGANREIRLNVRVIAATHVNLEAAVANREFRQDLFHRLRVVCLGLAPLRERTQDFPRLLESSLLDVSASAGKAPPDLAPEVRREFEKYAWPGNIRELRNVLEYAIAAAEDGVIQRRHLPSWLLEGLGRVTEDQVSREVGLELAKVYFNLNHEVALARFEREYLCYALRENEGRINRTARQIGINKTTLLRRIQHYGLLPERRRRGETSLPLLVNTAL